MFSLSQNLGSCLIHERALHSSTKCILSAIWLLLQHLSFRWMSNHLPVSTGSQWFEVQNLTNTFRNFGGKILDQVYLISRIWFKSFIYMTFGRIYDINRPVLHKLVFGCLLDSILVIQLTFTIHTIIHCIVHSKY